MDLNILQHYWWILICILGGLLVFLLFVQGGQSLLYTIGKNKDERDLIVNTLGHKWEYTFTTLVVFGGAFFASFPLFYSTSFGGAYVVWMLILFCFVLQAVSYEYRIKKTFSGQSDLRSIPDDQRIRCASFVGSRCSYFLYRFPFPSGCNA